MVLKNGLVTNITQNIFLCVQQNKEIIITKFSFLGELSLQIFSKAHSNVKHAGFESFFTWKSVSGLELSKMKLSEKDIWIC